MLLVPFRPPKDRTRNRCVLCLSATDEKDIGDDNQIHQYTDASYDLKILIFLTQVALDFFHIKEVATISIYSKKSTGIIAN